MSTLEKAINLLQTMPQHKLEVVYTYMQFVNTLTENEETAAPKSANSIVGIAHQYANSNLIPLEKETLQ